MQTAVDQTPTVKLHEVMQPFLYNIVLSLSNSIMCLDAPKLPPLPT